MGISSKFIVKNTNVDNTTLEINGEGQIQSKTPYNIYSKVLVNEEFTGSKSFDFTTLSNLSFKSLKIIMDNTGNTLYNHQLNINGNLIYDVDNRNELVYLDVNIINGKIYVKGYLNPKTYTESTTATKTIALKVGSGNIDLNSLSITQNNLRTTYLKIIGYN